MKFNAKLTGVGPVGQNQPETAYRAQCSDLLACLKGPWTADEFVAVLTEMQSSRQPCASPKTDSSGFRASDDNEGTKTSSPLRREWLKCLVLRTPSRLLRLVSRICIFLDSYICRDGMVANAKVSGGDEGGVK